MVDTCVLIDVLENDASFGAASAELLDSRRGEGLVVCPVTYVELAPGFLGNLRLQNDFLSNIGIDFSSAWTNSDTIAAHQAWNRHVVMKRKKTAAKRPLADILIGAFASNRTGLLTRNPNDFTAAFPSLRIMLPAKWHSF